MKRLGATLVMLFALVASCSVVAVTVYFDKPAGNVWTSPAGPEFFGTVKVTSASSHSL